MKRFVLKCLVLTGVCVWVLAGAFSLFKLNTFLRSGFLTDFKGVFDVPLEDTVGVDGVTLF